MEVAKLIIEIILVLIGFYLIFFQSFLQEKGKNLATKNDIGKITQEIEKVKNEFSFENQKKLDLFFETKKCFLDFYENYFLWVESMRIADIILSYHDNKQILRNTIENLKKNHSEVFKYYSRIHIYSTDKDFNKNIVLIYGDTVSNHNLAFRFLLSLEDFIMKYDGLKAKVEYLNEKREIEEFKNDLKKLKQKRDDCMSDYHNELDALKEQLSQNQTLLQKIISQKITNDFS